MQTESGNHIVARFRETARKRPDHTALIYLGSRFSYRRILELSDRLAGALLERGLQPGETAVLYLPNGIQWVIAWLGVMRAGGVCVPITPIYTPHDLEYIANDSDAETIICADTNFGYVKNVLSRTKLKRVVVTRMTDLLPWWKRWFGYLYDIVPKGAVSLDETTCFFSKVVSSDRFDPDRLPVLSGGDQIAEILYTGGTTKFPKGVPITHNLFLQAAWENITVSASLFAPEENIIFGNAPMFHVLGQTCGLATLLVGGTLILQPRINLDATFDTIQRFRARTMIGVPTLYRMILEHDRLDQYDLSSVEYWFSAGDVLPTEVGNRWRDTLGRRIYQGYGATETCGGVALCPLDVENPPKSVGRVLPSKTVLIVDPATLEPVEPGTPGELLVSSEYMVDHYIKKPEESRATFIEKDGRLWYRTADVMRMDADGNLYFVDRTVDTIKHKGYRVSASEIESVLQEHPAVISSCVVGIPDPAVGERIKAYVVLKEDTKGITGYELIKWCRQSLVSYKIPQYIEFRDMLPKSKVGKLLRREIRDEEKRRATS